MEKEVDIDLFEREKAVERERRMTVDDKNKATTLLRQKESKEKRHSENSNVPAAKKGSSFLTQLI